MCSMLSEDDPITQPPQAEAFSKPNAQHSMFVLLNKLETMHCRHVPSVAHYTTDWGCVCPKFHLARLDSTRHDSTRSTLSSESSRAVPTWRTTNKL